MNCGDIEQARRWLEAQGVRQVSDGVWAEGGVPAGTLTSSEVAHTWTSVALEERGRDAAARLRLAFGLLDLLGEYWVTCEIRAALKDNRDPLPAEAFWAGYRHRLEAPDEPEAVIYSLWVDWFEDPATAEAAFAEVVGHDLAEILDGTAPAGIAGGPLFRRARRVLCASGPVSWPVKYPVYRTAATFPELQPAVFRAILGSYHDFYGDLEPHSALALLRQLSMPSDTEHFTALCDALEAGHTSHYLSRRLAADAGPPEAVDQTVLSERHVRGGSHVATTVTAPSVWQEAIRRAGRVGLRRRPLALRA
ncbi:hypothetical protein K2224_15745 [Streptomyces sp. BHT-5-2]|uniref:hypothetical protein n=1 Tax=Streptomyces sp. BHT-5-2 TaxID=2866715 RepID=UPI001C8DAEB8|nr:hypothetical protein [Streptomyces sp. BHT-5-2]QZL04444.1 hypothetical protein K2224_15745 [Streptomyces sp. BHT-5-2]